MSAEPGSCHSTPGCSLQDDRDTEVEVTESSRNLNMDLQQPILSALNVLRNEIRSAKEDSGLSGKAAVTSSDSESGIFSGESELCVEHESDLDWFCCSEQKLICSHCTIVGSCQGHTVTALANRVTAVRNHLVDVCEKMQLQALRIEHFINKTLTAKERALQVEASGARERVVAQTSGQEIADRVEDAEGVGEPCDTDRLNLNAGCSDSKLMRGLWASAILLGPIAYGSAHLTFDERTVSSLLSLSEDLCTLTFLPKRSRQSPPYDPARFDSWPNALGTLSISSGTHSWVMDVGESGAFKVGVCYTSMGRKGSGNNSRLGYNGQSWVLSKYDGDFSFCHAGKNTPLHVIHKPKSLGLLLDWPSQTLVFYDPDSSAVLHSVRHAFSGPLLPAFAVADRSVTILHCPPK
ncbi:B box and SPRY domain-containing protein-like isoform X2 [Oncorhynchus clarkii lewisi]|uniref:B box and SPRY domain-containing protein-like isoform X2 n=1 Tax=Oncorhynchus clarkii lewisi TaxID=490388 RepID=UPI0039B85B75